MKKLFTIVSLSILLFCTYNANTEEIRYIHKIANEEYFTVQGSYAEQFGDSIMFWSFFEYPKTDSSIVKDSTYFDFFLMTYYDDKFDSIPIKSIKNEIVGNYTYLSQIVEDKKGDLIFGFKGGGLYRISNGEIVHYDSLVKALNIKAINSLAIGEKNELYIQYNAKILKVQENDVTTLSDATSEYYKQPHYSKFCNFNMIGSKIFFLNFSGAISYFDTKTGIFDSLSIISHYPNIKSSYTINIESAFDKYLNIIIVTVDEGKFYCRYYQETGVIEKLDIVFENYLPNYFTTSMFGTVAFDKMKNTYFTIADPNYFDTLYVLTMENKIIKYLLVDENWPYHGGFSLKCIMTKSNGDVIIPAGRGLFVIPAEGTSVEAPKNLIFLKNLYPNPARDRIRIDFGVEPVNLSSTKLEIYDYLGRLTLETNTEVEYNSSTGNGTMTCDISKLHTGFYIAVLTNGKYKRSTPLFVE